MRNHRSMAITVMVTLILSFLVPIARSQDIAGRIYAGEARSANGRSWAAVLKISSFDALTGRVEGVLEWPDLNAVNRIAGTLAGAWITFRETEYVKKGGAHLNVNYTGSIEAGVVSGQWAEPGGDKGSFRLQLQSGQSQPVVKPASPGYAGASYGGSARSSASGRSWQAILRITTHDPGSGAIVGQLEWPSLNSIHRIEGKLKDGRLTFRETAYIRKGSAHLNVDYDATLKDNVITGVWNEVAGDSGTFSFKRN